MILDSLKSFERYITLHERFGKVYEFIKSHDLHSLEDGKHVIEEDNIWCTVSTSEAREDAPLEVHDSFIDIHIVLEGTEMKESPEAYISYSGDNFVICFPQDSHAPLLGSGTVRKAVFKVRL